jgi:DNA-binding HxlR family transcriptional regulator
MRKVNEDDLVRVKDKLYPCTLSVAMDLVGGKWKVVILYYLKDGEKRYSELRRDLYGVTEMTLSLQLKQLEADGLISRQVFGDKPPIKVVYNLTEFGKSFNPVLSAIRVWGNQIAEEQGEFVKRKPISN